MPAPAATCCRSHCSLQPCLTPVYQRHPHSSAIMIQSQRIPMDPERLQRMERLFHAALEREPNARASYLAEVCADPELRLEVASLLERHDSSGPLDRNLIHAGTLSTTAKLSHGARLGPYQIEKLLGSGG